eukprot:TRINITY_DN6925_c0_g1_i4.p2 TRINITY_DN6925_c0_g1~~TRINITY_DN6925_c0_g1_i4.p2  ORF type:complete len:351 (+),score=86.84 TRINITY_DN6925_c0_g1_i4:245-1297(+)
MIEVLHNLAITDIVHIVLYGSKVQTLFENESIANKESLIAKINSVRTEGSTNLWGGMEEGAKLLEAHKQEGYASRLFMFSDGQVNVGIQDKAEIFKRTFALYKDKNIKSSAFGLGKDFDEEIMKGIAENGNGAYFFIEGADSMSEFVDFALNYILKMVASDAILKVRGEGKGIVTKLFGYDDVRQANLGDLREENVRTVVVELEIRADKDATEKIATYELIFKDPAGKAPDGKISGSVSATFTADEALIDAGKNHLVQIKLALQESAELDKKLVRCMDQSKTKKAIVVQQEQVTLLESVVDTDEKVFSGANKVASILKQAKEGLEKLKKQGVTEAARKEADHRGYTVRRG